jgi:hypothetical protein
MAADTMMHAAIRAKKPKCFGFSFFIWAMKIISKVMERTIAPPREYVVTIAVTSTHATSTMTILSQILLEVRNQCVRRGRVKMIIRERLLGSKAPPILRFPAPISDGWTKRGISSRDPKIPRKALSDTLKIRIFGKVLVKPSKDNDARLIVKNIYATIRRKIFVKDSSGKSDIKAENSHAMKRKPNQGHRFDRKDFRSVFLNTN